MKPAAVLEDARLFAQARRVADIIFEHVTPNPRVWKPGLPWLDDRRDQSPNGYYDQTESGLFLIVTAMPHDMWTPWGLWGFGGSSAGHWTRFDVLESRFGAVLIREERGVQTYALHHVDGQPLPAAVQGARSYAGREDYERARDAWEQLAASAARSAT